MNHLQVLLPVILKILYNIVVLIYVTTEPEADHMSIIRNIEEMVKRKNIL
jgi:hypothetical protein